MAKRGGTANGMREGTARCRRRLSARRLSARRLGKSAALLLSCAGMGGACGGDDGAFSGPVESDGSTAGRAGVAGSGPALIFCKSAADCLLGHDCIVFGAGGGVVAGAGGAPLVDEVGECSLECVPALCSPRACVSRTGTCGSVGCQNSSECRLDEFCETSSLTCRPAAGVCRTNADCFVPNVVRSVADVACDRTCRLQPKRLLAPAPPFVGARQFDVSRPRRGDIVSELETYEFRFAPTPGPAIALILKNPTAVAARLLEDAVWGAVLPAGARNTSWSQGYAIEGSSWQAAGGSAPSEGTFYFLVQVLQRGELLAHSDLIPFTVSAPPRSIGSECTDYGVGTGECQNPDVVLGCIDGRCSQVFSSHAECEPGKCADPMEGVRYCYE